jgi:hypothetical protein
MDNNGGSAGDDICHVSAAEVPNARSSIATENTRLAPDAKQTYFKEQRIHIPDTERVCTVNVNVLLWVTVIVNATVYILAITVTSFPTCHLPVTLLYDTI